MFADKKSGKNALRPELQACHAFLTPGDTLIVPELARYGRSLHDLTSANARSASPACMKTSTPPPQAEGLVFHVFAALAEFIRELIIAGTHEGLPAARARGRVGGRPTVVDAELLKAARDLLPDQGPSVTSIAKLLGVSVGPLYNHIPDLQENSARHRKDLPPEASGNPRSPITHATIIGQVAQGDIPAVVVTKRLEDGGGLLVRGDRFVEAPLLLQRVAEVVQRPAGHRPPGTLAPSPSRPRDTAS
ncbi:DNA invertase Pin-like site-specific DNA recombinase [Nonomuraea endophytica]|uniref:DNA invertase Pin-like site-specific DNA recombinase n=1 Tax=Nonomuraea endophytica TaxID=714136 RepID=A0A7W8A9V2_9ACTN|nr:DNA invertase Pin-like site-specific DNA recombinase [Nonomuraea endophytica]